MEPRRHLAACPIAEPKDRAMSGSSPVLPPSCTRRRSSGRPWRHPASGLLTAAVLVITQGPGPADARQLLDVRFGRHQDQIRAVIDLDSAGPFTEAVSADGLTVTIDLAETGIKTIGSRTLTNLAPLVGLSIAPAAAPTTAEVRFLASGPVRVLSVRALPSEANAHHRIAIDFVAAPAAPHPPPGPTPRPAPVTAGVPVPPALVPPPVAAAPPLPGPVLPPTAPVPTPMGLGRPLEVPEEARPPTFAPLSPRSGEAATATESARTQRLLDQARQAQDSNDDAGAFVLYRQAADAGSPEAAFAIGQMYRLGAGVVANPTLAAFWYGEAARAGYPPAEMNLGVMQLRGIGLDANPAAGLDLIKRAAAHGNQSALDLLDDIARARATPSAQRTRP